MISRGMNYAQAADAVGIHRDTLNDWEHTKSDFSDALRKAKAEGINRRLERIERAAKKGDWRADAWWLERVYPDQFGKPQSNTLLPPASEERATVILMPPLAPRRPIPPNS